MLRLLPPKTPALAAAVLSALALGACGSESTDTTAPSPVRAAAPDLNTGDLEAKLSNQLGRSAGVSPKGVDCPGGIEVEKGRGFQCTLTAPNGDEVRVDVTLTNDDGGFRAVVPPQQPRSANADGRADSEMP